jgi:hypothetical protein
MALTVFNAGFTLKTQCSFVHGLTPTPFLTLQLQVVIAFVAFLVALDGHPFGNFAPVAFITVIAFVAFLAALGSVHHGRRRAGRRSGMRTGTIQVSTTFFIALFHWMSAIHSP